ncbi:MAG: S49 family peptidase, partial [Alphaproteobacteria bacterium]|nr:S49 family peptidase [Alphaproteobacteria bacterium]
MQYRNIVQAFATTPFACMPEKLQEIAQLLELKATGAVLPQAEVAARIGGRREVGAAPVALHQAAGGSSGTGRGATIAVIPIYGVIAQRMGMMSEISGGTSTQRVSADLRQAVADPRVSRIVLDIDSPGGGVYGISELADEIRKSRGPKPIIAQANSLMASAAYWIGSACDELVCTPSGEVGSIGVYGVHEDWSTAYADAGIKFTLVKAGKFKAEGVDFEPLSKEAAGDMQRRVDEYYS